MCETILRSIHRERNDNTAEEFTKHGISRAVISSLTRLDTYIYVAIHSQVGVSAYGQDIAAAGHNIEV